jgi:hypothetical protein
MSFEPYQAPAVSRDARPAAILWFRAYAATMTLASLAMLALALTSKLGGAGTEPTTALALVALLLTMLYGVATFVPFKPWGWTWALVAIALGVASGGALFAIPLLFFWWKPQVKAAFARL